MSLAQKKKKKKSTKNREKDKDTTTTTRKETTSLAHETTAVQPRIKSIRVRACKQPYFGVTRASGEEQRDPAGRSLLKRRQESEPTLISVIFSLIYASSERSDIPLDKARKVRRPLSYYV